VLEQTAATGMMAQELKCSLGWGQSPQPSQHCTTGYSAIARNSMTCCRSRHTLGTQTRRSVTSFRRHRPASPVRQTVGTPRLMTQGTISPTGFDLHVAVRGERLLTVLDAVRTFTTPADGCSSSTSRAARPRCRAKRHPDPASCPHNAHPSPSARPAKSRRMIPGQDRADHSRATGVERASFNKAGLQPSATPVLSTRRLPHAAGRVPNTTAWLTCIGASLERTSQVEAVHRNLLILKLISRSAPYESNVGHHCRRPEAAAQSQA